ncbi:RDD family protein [Streptomyces sp. NBC_00328]|uniref:RDD family protein n=1 Tax=Streptomyces sp. NBC_00328 TaxID=2903646 RepID=UPI002E27D929|nr:RDD family protein [Streptomyces sp. NBC_00328]
MSELVTGEAVALELRPAKLPSRALAVVLDLALAVAVYIVVTIGLVAATAALDDAAQIAVSIASFLLVLVGGPIAVETLSHGRSLGKLACGLRVVRDDGGPIRFRHALVRGAVGVVEILMTFGIVACIASLVSERGRRLGDVFAGTLVVRERIPVGRMPYVPAPPPWLAGRFAELDLSAVPDGLWLAVRQYLTRMRQLDPQIGGAMAERLAVDLAARTGAPAPQGVPAGAYLAAVVHERQTREARRTFGAVPGGFASPAPGGHHFPQPGQPGGPVGHPVQPGVPAGYPFQPGAAAGYPPQPGAPVGHPFHPGPGAHPTRPAPAGYGVAPQQPSPPPAGSANPVAPPNPVAPVAPVAPVEHAGRDERPSTGFAPPA